MTDCAFLLYIYLCVVVTSRDNGPAAVAQAVENMQNPLGIRVTGSAHFVSPKSSSTLPQVKAATSKKRPKTGNSRIY